jgi:hypothetical protein
MKLFTVYLAGNISRPVYVGIYEPTERREELLDQIWAAGNDQGEENDVYVPKTIRSLMKGDIIKLDENSYWRINSIGFTQVEPSEFVFTYSED